MTCRLCWALFSALSVAVRMHLDAFNSVLFSCFDFLSCFLAFRDGFGFCDVFLHRINFFPTLRVDFTTVFLGFFAFPPSILSPIVTCFLPFFCSFRFSLDFLFRCFGFCSGFDSSSCPSVTGCCCRLLWTAGCTWRFSSSHGQSKPSIFLFKLILNRQNRSQITAFGIFNSNLLLPGADWPHTSFPVSVLPV